jgi:hypothetical protein
LKAIDYLHIGQWAINRNNIKSEPSALFCLSFDFSLNGVDLIFLVIDTAPNVF